MRPQSFSMEEAALPLGPWPDFLRSFSFGIETDYALQMDAHMDVGTGFERGCRAGFCAGGRDHNRARGTARRQSEKSPGHRRCEAEVLLAGLYSTILLLLFRVGQAGAPWARIAPSARWYPRRRAPQNPRLHPVNRIHSAPGSDASPAVDQVAGPGQPTRS